MMEGFGERADLRTMQREQERERRRIRDRQRRQSMTQEQREMHLARRRRNYQLRRQRAANAHASFIPLTHQHQLLESSAGEASTSDDFQAVTSSTSLDYSVLCLPQHGINQGLETFNFGTKVDEGSSSHLETLAHNPVNSSRRLRLSHIKCLARNVTCPNNDLADTHQVAAELITKEDLTAGGDYGSTPKSLRLNCVKRVARSKNSPPKDSIAEKNRNLHPEGIQVLVKESCIASS
ncbi:hypothetical protein Lal_00013208 [Lupinus albus]|uniref:Uncharacterized protein n=1 Tax=Lupinus albus TaxID=3870 RepID=A0A6A4NRD7_LUPAL|nr:hypothetical protein Lalb_Chr18g0057111 [Lupinus albus]KAF1890613.1 hypothetical protein Lal_00013208 [Lupinus albus]